MSYLKCESLEQAEVIEADIADNIGLPDDKKATRYATPVEHEGFYYLPVTNLQYNGIKHNVASYVAEHYGDIPQITAEEYQALWPVEEDILI